LIFSTLSLCLMRIQASSQVDVLLLVVNFVIKLVEVTDNTAGFEWNIGSSVTSLGCLKFSIEFVPFSVESLSIFFILRYCVQLFS